MDEQEGLAARFEDHRAHLQDVAYRMLGSRVEADDAVQEAWLRLSRSDADVIENLGGWLTTVIARICLNVLRARNTHGEQELPEHVPDPVIHSPEDEAALADSVSLALLFVLDSLSPAERLAFVLHDTFGMSFEDIAPMLDRTPSAARQLASRARRRVQGADIPAPDADLERQRQVVDAFFEAARDGNFDRLLTLLDPDVVLRSDIAVVMRGAETVAKHALGNDYGGERVRKNAVARPAIVNGQAGVVGMIDGRPFVVMAFTVVQGRIAEIDAFINPARVRRTILTFDTE